MKVIAIVPDGMEVEQRKGLSGPLSEGQAEGGRNRADPKDATDGYWYGPSSPAEGWRLVASVPDPSWAEANWPRDEPGDGADSR